MPISTPPGMDIPRIEAALRTLAETAVAEEWRATAQRSALPDFADNPITRTICLPVSTACRTAYQKLGGHLVGLIGHRAATEICQRVARAVGDEGAALAAQPSTARH